MTGAAAPCSDAQVQDSCRGPGAAPTTEASGAPVVMADDDCT